VKRLLPILLLCLPCWAANDFSGDPNCVALWRLESGALTTDTIGSHTLTSNNSPVADTSNYKEGAGSVDLERDDTDYYSLAYADMDSDWPLKDGSAPTQLSVCAWVRTEDPDQYCAIAGRWGYAGSRVWMVSTYPTGANDYIYTYVSSNGAAYEFDGFTSVALVPGQWYHVTWTWDNSTKAWNTYVYDADADTKYSENGTFTNAMTTSETMQFQIGLAAGDPYDGLIDEVVLFNDILTTSEDDEIIAGTYGGAEQPADSVAGETIDHPVGRGTHRGIGAGL
jgi:hypothetical protein